MLCLFVYLLVVVGACAGSPISSQVLGGNDGDIFTFPYMLSVVRFDTHQCGAFIISPDWALTDSWCALAPVQIDDFIILSGSATLGNGTEHTVVQWVHHPLNVIQLKEYDFALIQVDPPFEFGENVAPVALVAQDQETPADVDAFIVGWGAHDSGNWTTPQLQFANVTLLNEAGCSESLGEDFQYSKLCAQDLNGVATHCSRDEGGPVVVDGTAYGVILYPGLCADAQGVKVYGRIASVRDWIDATMAG